MSSTPVMDRWNELPLRVRDDILDKHRDINTHYRWWDCVYEDFKEDMAEIGIEVDRMHFSGFWNQGDGACFEGYVNDWGLFMQSLGYTSPLLIEHFRNYARFSVEHRGYYSHENCTVFTADWPSLDSHDEDDLVTLFGYDEELRNAALIAVLSVPENRHDAMEAQFTESFKDHMRSLYRRLKDEYEHQTSDEAVLETLYANDMLDELIDDVLAVEE